MHNQYHMSCAVTRASSTRPKWVNQYLPGYFVLYKLYAWTKVTLQITLHKLSNRNKNQALIVYNCASIQLNPRSIYLIAVNTLFFLHFQHNSNVNLPNINVDLFFFKQLV